jgi:tRNA-specific 2-thiouridylase
VGPRSSLATTTVHARGRLYLPTQRAHAKLRYRSPAAPALVETTDGGFTLHLEEPVYGAAAGQAAVLYDGDVVVGCGTIATAA